LCGGLFLLVLPVVMMVTMMPVVFPMVPPKPSMMPVVVAVVMMAGNRRGIRRSGSFGGGGAVRGCSLHRRERAGGGVGLRSHDYANQDEKDFFHIESNCHLVMAI
jgi:hypothetical protein